MNCQAAVKRDGELRQCKRRAQSDCSFCAEHREAHARWEVFAWKAVVWLSLPRWLFWLRWMA